MKRLLTLLLTLAALCVQAQPPARELRYDDEGRTLYPTHLSRARALCVPVDFPDIHFSVDDPQNHFRRMLNERGYTDYGAHGCAAEYFMDCSRGLFSPIFDITRVITLPRFKSYYSQSMAHWQEGVQYIVSQLDKELDFALYDMDDDGAIDNIHFFFAGQPSSSLNTFDSARPYCETYTLSDLRPDGKRVASFSCSAEMRSIQSRNPQPAGIAPFCQCYSHVLGLPNLNAKNNDQPTATPGAYALMDTGYNNENTNCPPMLSAFELWQLRWLDPVDVDIALPDTIIAIPALTGDTPLALRLRCPSNDGIHSSEFFMVETRADHSWDAAIPDHGILIWHVNYHSTYWKNNIVNNMGLSRYTTLMCHPSTRDAIWPGTSLDYAFADTDYTPDFKPVMAPPSLFNLKLCTTYDADTHTGYLHINPQSLPDAPDDVTRPLPPVRTEWYTRRLRFSWEPAQDDGIYQTQYILTVSRPDPLSPDRLIYLDGCDHRVLSSLQYEMSISSLADWDAEWQVSIRTIHGIPSTLESDPLTFIPSQCEDLSGISTTHADSKDTQWWTLQGVRLDNKPSQHGIYIVQQGETTRKVMVK